MDEPTEVVGETVPEDDWEHKELYDRVKETIVALPSYFDSDISIRGLDAEDLFSLGGVLATAIENNVVETLNEMRAVWDPDDEYPDCSFMRQSQTFPDVLLVRRLEGGESEPIMGIELKSWYLLSKEGEPSFRYEVTPDACAPQDLLVVFTWSLNDVISGEPQIYEPYVCSAKWASRYVDYYWKELRDTDLDRSINRPDGIGPYPASKSDAIQDDPVEDSGGNYGRLARANMMDDYLTRMVNGRLAGIRAEKWIEFLVEAREEDTQAQLSL